VAALANTGGRYRVHDANLHHAGHLRLERVRATVRTTHVTHGHMQRLAETLGMAPLPSPERDDRSLVFLSQRLVSLRLDPGGHPFPGDNLGRLAGRGTSAALKRADLPMGLRALYVAWFLGMITAPRAAVPWLAEQLLYPERRGALSALVERLRRPA
jgi:hypothetical protein